MTEACEAVTDFWFNTLHFRSPRSQSRPTSRLAASPKSKAAVPRLRLLAASPPAEIWKSPPKNGTPQTLIFSLRSRSDQSALGRALIHNRFWQRLTLVCFSLY